MRVPVEDEVLQPFADSTKCQFVILYVEPSLGGGLSINFTFLDLPTRVFWAWVYSFVDEESEQVTGYELRSIRLADKETDFTKEELIETINKLAREQPESKFLW